MEIGLPGLITEPGGCPRCQRLAIHPELWYNKKKYAIQQKKRR